ncbi:hypothetical protein [Nocardia farcinica]|uniref:hypothetical protein n=2 Tax=Nocardia farcinica TaxID=37329 RepID=UPI001895AA00|nr:hypothetical protein [Nocardia farcinica]MBF6522822.1 hypothetical protein [Nocardia farcinica]
MLYLIRPPQTVEWIDLPHTLVNLVDEHPEIDLARLEWKPTESIGFHPTILRLALRAGKPCSAGIVMKGTDLVPYTWLLQLIEQSQKPLPKLQSLPGADLMEHLIPGWSEQNRELDERVAQSLRDTIARARRELEEELDAPTADGLPQHWRDLGGALPDPI